MTTSMLSGRQLLEFLKEQMSMSGRYQPLLLRDLILHDGVLSRDQWVRTVLETEPGLWEWASRTAMRWPIETLVRGHKIVEYDKTTKTLGLHVSWESPEQRVQAIEICEARLKTWRSRHRVSGGSRRIDILTRDGGRCQACGVTAQQAPLDIDHIVPRSHAKDGMVATSDGQLVPLDSSENLQTLCARCNREKGDRSSYDFRASRGQLVKALAHTYDLVNFLPESDRRAVIAEAEGMMSTLRAGL